jgi:hypothetical protein
MNKSLHWDDLPTDRREKRTPRLLAAAMLRLGSSILNRVARRLAAAERRRNARYHGAILEFYAEAGAPEGALYANGVLIGYLDGVRRL